MKYQLLRMALAVPLLLLCAWPRTSVAQPAITYAVAAWGYNYHGQTTAPLAAQSGVTAIAAGDFHTVALKNDGSVMAWGGTDAGETTVPVAAQSGVTAIAAGGQHTVALKNDGSVVAWGWNYFGQTMVPVAAQIGVVAIAAGGDHTVALENDGSVVAWGANHFGQVTGTPTTNAPYSATASQVTLGGQVLSGVTAIAAGGQHTVVLKIDGSVVAWGANYSGQTTVPVEARSGVRAIAAGGQHTVALKNDGSVVAWGNNLYGQTTVPVEARSGVRAIAAGGQYSVALKNDGSVVAWGNNDYGQTTVPATAQSGVTAIAAGGGHTVALVIPTPPNITKQPVSQAVNVWQSASFAVVATGYPLMSYQWRKDGVDLAGATNATYSLAFVQTNQAGHYTVVVSNSAGSVTSAPPAVLTVNPAAAGVVVVWESGGTVPLAAQSGVTAIAAAGVQAFRLLYAHTVALKQDGSVVEWDKYSETTVPVGAQNGVTAIAAGNNHTVALRNDGSVVAWGLNYSGQVTGTPPTELPYDAIASPVTLEGQILSAVTGISAGGYHTVALKNDGTVVAWGNNSSGQVTGTSTTEAPYDAIASPVRLEGQVLSGVTAIAAGALHTVALKNDGSVVSWGSFDQSTVPFAAQSGVTAIAAGMWHTVALKNDGSVVAWGSLDQEMVPVAAQSGVKAIAAGYEHTVALKNDGTVVAWGANYFGQVTGTPTTEAPYYAIANPVTLESQVLSGVTAIAAGNNHTVALIGGVPLLPSLTARPNGNELILSWPTNAPGFTLQSTLDLTPPVTWTDSTSTPTVIGAHFTLTNTSSGDARFYRLRKM